MCGRSEEFGGGVQGVGVVQSSERPRGPLSDVTPPRSTPPISQAPSKQVFRWAHYSSAYSRRRASKKKVHLRMSGMIRRYPTYGVQSADSPSLTLLKLRTPLLPDDRRHLVLPAARCYSRFATCPQLRLSGKCTGVLQLRKSPFLPRVRGIIDCATLSFEQSLS